jgi:hypothetical protein
LWLRRWRGLNEVKFPSGRKENMSLEPKLEGILQIVLAMAIIYVGQQVLAQGKQKLLR